MAKNSKKIKEESIFNKETSRFIIFLVVLVVLFFVLYYSFGILNTTFNQVKYEGLTFTKEKMGTLTFYRYTYHFTDDKKKIVNYNLYVRTRPDENNVSVDGQIVFGMDKGVYLGINSGALSKCEDSSISIGTLAQFISANGFVLKSGLTDALEANLTNRSFIECNVKSNITTIIIDSSNESKITKEGLCYRINFAQCDILKAVEKFEVQAVVDAKKLA